MRYLFLLLFIPALGFAQLRDTAAHARIDEIKLHLDKHHKQFQVGTGIMISGLAVEAASLVLLTSNPPAEPEVVLGTAIAGGALMLIGTFVQIDSHKWFSKDAGQPRVTGNYYR